MEGEFLLAPLLKNDLPRQGIPVGDGHAPAGELGEEVLDVGEKVDHQDNQHGHHEELEEPSVPQVDGRQRRVEEKKNQQR